MWQWAEPPFVPTWQMLSCPNDVTLDVDVPVCVESEESVWKGVIDVTGNGGHQKYM